METVVIDANFGIGLVYPMPYSIFCRQKLEEWLEDGTQVAIPALWDYEVISVLRKQRAQNRLSQEEIAIALEGLFRLPLRRIPADLSLANASLAWAEQLGQLVAYDAQYLALAERLKAPFFTADQKLYNRCREIGAGFVHFVQNLT